MKLQYKYVVAIIYAMVLFLDRLDVTVINVTLPTLSHFFNVPIIETDWISIAFLLAFAISIPISSWLGDRFGLKRIYLIAVILVGLGSGLCLWVVTFDQLIILRFIQGLGGGMLVPVGMTMLYREFDRSDYASITSYTFLPALIAPAIAPFIGGIILDHFGWRLVYFFSGPICFVLALCIAFFLKADYERKKYPLDWIGFFLSSGLLIDVFYTLAVVSREGFTLLFFIGMITSALLLISFVAWEKRITHPLINLEFFKSPLFIKANLIQSCFQICHLGAIFLIGIYLQVGIGMSASMAGLIMGMQALGAMASSRYSVKLFNQYGPKLPLTIGLSGVAVLSLCVMVIQDPDMIIFGLILFFTRGLFSGLCGAAIQTLGMMDFSKAQIGQASSIFNICRQVAISLGFAISSILISVGLKMNGLVDMNHMDQNPVLLGVFSLGFIAIALIAVLGIIIIQTLKIKSWKEEKVQVPNQNIIP